jgi:hypothetical protein
LRLRAMRRELKAAAVFGEHAEPRGGVEEIFE